MMQHECKNVNDIVYLIAKRAGTLANEKMTTLRMIADNYCDNPKHASRGNLIEQLLIEEFTEEFPSMIEVEQ